MFGRRNNRRIDFWWRNKRRWVGAVAVASIVLAIANSATAGLAATPTPTPSAATEIGDYPFAGQFSPGDPFGRINGHPGRLVFHPTHERLAATAAQVTPMAFPTTSGSGPLLYHGGPVVQPGSKSYAIFWIPSGYSVSASYESLIDRYFGDVGGHPLYNVNTQYYDGRGNIVNNSQLAGSVTDTTPFPSSSKHGGGGCSPYASYITKCLTDGQIQTEINNVISAQGWTPDSNSMFYMFTPLGVGSCAGPGDCAFTQYCAYHGDTTNNVLYANMPYTGTNLSACGAPVTPNNDVNSDSTINVTSHEQMESVTDPFLNAWYDSTGEEIGDKCAWQFGTYNANGNVDWNGHPYIVQTEYSNADAGCVLSYGNVTPTATPTLTVTPATTATATNTPTVTATATATNTPTLVNTPTVTNTPAPTNTSTATSTPASTGTATNTPTLTSTPSITNTPTVTNTAAPTHTSTPSTTPTQTSTPTPTPAVSCFGICF